MCEAEVSLGQTSDKIYKNKNSRIRAFTNIVW
jgi:hypothetical protein